jgi:hypothetical protein
MFSLPDALITLLIESKKGVIFVISFSIDFWGF